jgi:hypothetical protein
MITRDSMGEYFPEYDFVGIRCDVCNTYIGKCTQDRQDKEDEIDLCKECNDNEEIKNMIIDYKDNGAGFFGPEELLVKIKKLIGK